MSEIITTTVTITAALLMQWSEPTTASYDVGVSTYYKPGLMADVVENRNVWVPNGVVPVALNRHGDLGRTVWLLWPSGRIDVALSVDCSQRGHYQRRLAKDRIVDVPAWLAIREGFYGWGPWPVRVLFGPPPGVWD